MTSFADLTRQLTAAYDRLTSIADSIANDTDPRGTLSERMAEFAAADDEWRRLDEQWRRAFHDASVT